MYLEFDQMPENARIWIYQSSRKFSDEEIELIENKLQKFCESWNTHGTLMPTSFAVKDSQVVMLAVDESQLGASGCSIDSSVRILAEIEAQIGVNLIDQGKVSVKNPNQEITVLPALGLKSSLQENRISPDYLVINPRISTKKELESLWIPISESWLNKYFPN
ncbi:hypothetical protein ACFOSV_02355 [Algoriphagus namhaensis]|uniref:ABC transporter ATPase n=1 Tax=Algoriphagus namhaensis TaxID=915353 RepID=A0ABV8AQG2_9BACT